MVSEHARVQAWCSFSTIPMHAYKAHAQLAPSMRGAWWRCSSRAVSRNINISMAGVSTAGGTGGGGDEGQ